MIQTPSPRPRLATTKHLLAALMASALIQGGVAWAGPFTGAVSIDVYEPDPSTSGMITLNVDLQMSVGGQDWYLRSLTWTHPRNERGETLDFNVNRYIDWSELPWETGRIHIPLGAYWLWPGDPFGRFTGGEVVVTAARYAWDDLMHGYPIEERTISLNFGFMVPGPSASTPEPAAAIPAAIAAVGGAAFAAIRRRRAG